MRRYLPVVGHTDGTLSVLEWRRSKPVFQTEAHSPGPVTAIASTWNCVVSSGQHLSSPQGAGLGTPSLPGQRRSPASHLSRRRLDREDVACLPLC